MTTPQPSPLYLRLLGETARIDWIELHEFLKRGRLIGVATGLDLIGVAEAIADDDTDRVSAWMAANQLQRLAPEKALDYAARQPRLWAVVVSPWVLIQESAAPETPVYGGESDGEGSGESRGEGGGESRGEGGGGMPGEGGAVH